MEKMAQIIKDLKVEFDSIKRQNVGERRHTGGSGEKVIEAVKQIFNSKIRNLEQKQIFDELKMGEKKHQKIVWFKQLNF